MAIFTFHTFPFSGKTRLDLRRSSGFCTGGTSKSLLFIEQVQLIQFMMMMTTQHKDHRHFHLRNFLLRAGQTSLWASEWESWRRNCLRDMFRYMQRMTAWVITDYDDFDKIILWPGRQQLQATTHQYPNTTSQEGSQVFISLHSVQFVKYIFIYTLQCAVFQISFDSPATLPSWVQLCLPFPLWRQLSSEDDKVEQKSMIIHNVQMKS